MENLLRSSTSWAQLSAKLILPTNYNHGLECTRPRYFLPLYIPASIRPFGSLRRAGTENRQEICSKNHTEKTLLADLWLLHSAPPTADWTHCFIPKLASVASCKSNLN